MPLTLSSALSVSPASVSRRSLAYPFFFLVILPPPRSTLFPYTTLFRSGRQPAARERRGAHPDHRSLAPARGFEHLRSEEHTSELQSHSDLVCRLLLEKKKNDECTYIG